MSINPSTIMQGRQEVTLREAQKALRENRIRLKDAECEKLQMIQNLAIFILGVSLIMAFIGGCYLQTPESFVAMKLVAGALGLAAAAGIVALVAVCIKNHRLDSVKLNEGRVNQLLIDVKATMKQQGADTLRAAREHADTLNKWADKIHPQMA